MGGLGGQVGQIDGLGIVQAVAVFQAGEFEQAGDELFLFLGVAADAVEQLLLVGAEGAVLQQLEGGLLGSERGFEFVSQS